MLIRLIFHQTYFRQIYQIFLKAEYIVYLRMYMKSSCIC